jgi:acyl carrier protein
VSQELPGREAVLNDVVDILKDVTSDWDLDLSAPLGRDTRLVDDLAFESIDVVQFIVAIEQRYERRDFPFEDLLMTDGRYVDDITIGQLVDFLHPHVAAGGARA